MTSEDNRIYAERRARLASQLGKDGIAIVPTAPERQRNRDSDFLFRHDSYFYYLTGFTEPNAWLVLAGDGRSMLFCAPKDLELVEPAKKAKAQPRDVFVYFIHEGKVRAPAAAMALIERLKG